MDRKLKTIPPPKEGTAAVLMPAATLKGPIITGPGTTNLRCGECGSVLVKGMGNNIVGLVLVCPACRAYNQT